MKNNNNNTLETGLTDNLLLLTDSYKIGGHWNMFPDNTEACHSYFEARTGSKWDDIVFFGLQACIKRHLLGQVVTQEKIDLASEICKVHLGNDKAFNRAGWQAILDEFGGRLPVVIRAVPEGSVIPVSNVLMTIRNLGGEKFKWIVGYLETLLTNYMWYGSTVATQSRDAKARVKKFLEANSDNTLVDFFIHDFGARSVAVPEQALLGGMAHLINFKGTDTVSALYGAVRLYNADLNSLGFSVPASEHQLMSALGREGEAKMVGDLLDKYPTGILSLVADTYNVYDFAEKICGETYREKILSRNGTLVIRPDSGDPETVMLKLASILWKKFGGTTNSKGYKVINPKVRLLWGDGINMQGVSNILGFLAVNGFAAENVACFGIGSNLLQKVNRDDASFAFKCSAQMRDGVWHDVYKDPIDGCKKSKRGVLKLVKTVTGFETRTANEPGEDFMVEVFNCGNLVKEYNFEEIRKNARI